MIDMMTRATKTSPPAIAIHFVTGASIRPNGPNSNGANGSVSAIGSFIVSSMIIMGTDKVVLQACRLTQACARVAAARSKVMADQTPGGINEDCVAHLLLRNKFHQCV